MNTALLKREMRARGYSQEKLAEAIGANRCTINRKINAAHAGFTLREAFALAHALGLSRTDFDRIFIPNYQRQTEEAYEQKAKAQHAKP